MRDRSGPKDTRNAHVNRMNLAVGRTDGFGKTFPLRRNTHAETRDPIRRIRLLEEMPVRRTRTVDDARRSLNDARLITNRQIKHVFHADRIRI